MPLGYYVPDGNEALSDDLPAIVELIERTARWVHPETFRDLPVWAPHAARGRPLYDANWTHPYTNTRKSTNQKTNKFESNVAALKAFIDALDVASPKPKHWTVCHIWGYDDPSFAAGSAILQDPRYFSCVANMLWLPTSLKGFTDTLPEIKSILRVCAYYLYGWTCEHEAVAAQATLIRTGWVPDSYPNAWPAPGRTNVLPPGTAPYSERVRRKIAVRKSRIKANLLNEAYEHYPRAEVVEVLKFWRIDLG